MLVVYTLLVLSAIYLLPKLIKWLRMARKVNQFPGRKGYPILGNLLEYLGTPDAVFRETRKAIAEYSTSDVSRTWIFTVPCLFIYGPEDMEKMLGSTINITKGLFYEPFRPWLGDGLLVSTGPKWRSRRKAITPTFHFNILQDFLVIFNKDSREVVEAIRKLAHQDTDIVPLMTTYTLNTICETAMGTALGDNQDSKNYRDAVHEIANLVIKRGFEIWLLIEAIYRFSKLYLRQKQIISVLHSFSQNIIMKKKMHGSEIREIKSSSGKKRMALLDLLLEAQKNGEALTDEDIREEVDTFIFEGHDTTALSLSYTLMLLANNKTCQEKIYEEIITIMDTEERDPTSSELQEMKYLEMCIKESLRLYPSVPMITRVVDEDFVTKSGHVIPKDSYIAACIYDMHRRSDLYPDPEKFDPDRFLQENTAMRHPYAYVPFSAGPRNCIGQKFAMMEMKCFLIAILRAFHLEPIDTPETVEILMDVLCRPKNPIRVKFVPRNEPLSARV